MRQHVLRSVGWATILIGLVHVAFTFRDYSGFGFSELWFLGSGFALLYTGALTLLARGERPGSALRNVAIAANVLGVVLGFAFCLLAGWTQPQGPVLVALFAVGAAGLAANRRAPTH